MNSALDWFLKTSMVVGVPVLTILLVTGFKTMTFTATCYGLNYKCELAYGAGEAMAMYMGDLLASNPGTEIVATPSKRK